MAEHARILDELDEAVRDRNSCPFSVAMKALSDHDRNDIEQALADPKYSTALILRALQRRGVSVGDKSLYSHRDGTCRCR